MRPATVCHNVTLNSTEPSLTLLHPCEMFVKCPHTCGHSKTKTASGIIWHNGSTYRDHLASSVHPNCKDGCPAYQKQKVKPDKITDEDWQSFADATFERFIKRKDRNALPINAIPKAFLSEENQERLRTVAQNSGERLLS